MRSAAIPRLLAPRVRAALADTPVVLIHGPRQSGKTTLARLVGARRGYRYVSFDEDAVRAAAERDPTGFVAELPERVILDEVQRVPALFTALKVVVDRRRVPGRFLLTGSANVLLVPTLADSLAGRMGILRLHPFAQCELARRAPRFLDALCAGRFPTRLAERLGAELAERIAGGGYPAALARRTAARRSAWYRDYVETEIQRDVRDLSRIRSLDTLPRLLALAASHTARLLNVSELAGPFQLTRQTIHDHVALLEGVFLLRRLPPWRGTSSSPGSWSGRQPLQKVQRFNGRASGRSSADRVLQPRCDPVGRLPRPLEAWHQLQPRDIAIGRARRRRSAEARTCVSPACLAGITMKNRT